MGISTYTGTVLPEQSTDDDVPAVLAGIFSNIDSRFVLRAQSTADRNSKFTDVPKNTLVACASEKALWLKLYDHASDVPAGSSLWWTVGQDLGWVDNALTPDPSGLWDITGQWMCVRNGWVDLQLRLTYIGSADIKAFNALGDCVNSSVGSISTAFAPKDFASMSTAHTGSGANFAIPSSGRIALSSMFGSGHGGEAVITNGTNFTTQGVWALGS